VIKYQVKHKADSYRIKGACNKTSEITGPAAAANNAPANSCDELGAADTVGILVGVFAGIVRIDDGFVNVLFPTGGGVGVNFAGENVVRANPLDGIDVFGTVELGGVFVGTVVVGHAVIGIAVLGSAAFDHAVIGIVVLGSAVFGHAVIGIAVLGSAVFGHAVIGILVLGQVVLGSVVFGKVV